MDSTTAIIIAIISVIGGGGLSAAIVGWLANRKKVNADIAVTLLAAAETRIKAYNERCVEVEARLDALEKEVKSLRCEVGERESMIETLQKENEGLKSQVKKLIAENKCKDRKIADLTERIRDLEDRLNKMGDGDG